ILEQAWRLTQNQKQPWTQHPQVRALPRAWAGARSTSAGDVLIDDVGHSWLVRPIGFSLIPRTPEPKADEPAANSTPDAAPAGPTLDPATVDMASRATEHFHGTIATYAQAGRRVTVDLIREPEMDPYCEVWADGVDNLTGDDRLTGRIPSELEARTLAAAFTRCRWDDDEAMAARGSTPIERLFPGLAERFVAQETSFDFWTVRASPGDAHWPVRFADDDHAGAYTHHVFVPALERAIRQVPSLLSLAHAAARGIGSESDRVAYARLILADIPITQLLAGASSDEEADEDKDQGQQDESARKPPPLPDERGWGDDE
ncbi:MAG TPA: hypothetical protein VNL71_15020, partial [Chloroflexota bacterium]|nr:hypothetical protein [Chloroflexota bacterium]